MTDLFHDRFPGRSQNLFRINGTRLLSDGLAHGLREGNAQIGRLIDLTDTALDAGANRVVRDAAGAVQDQGNRDERTDFTEPVQIQPRGILVDTMCGSNGGCERRNANSAA